MNSLDSMLERNKDYAAQQSAEGTLMPSLPRALPNVKAIIIGCADMRVDPAHVLGIEPGEAVVIRNIGGRITPGLLEQLSLLGRIGEVAREIPGGGGEFHIIVLQHTDCGITRLAGDPAMLAHYRWSSPKRAVIFLTVASSGGRSAVRFPDQDSETYRCCRRAQRRRRTMRDGAEDRAACARHSIQVFQLPS
jgi:carbonic anhydrase